MTNGYQLFAEGISLKKQAICSYETRLRTYAHVRGTERKCRTLNIHCLENVRTKSNMWSRRVAFRRSFLSPSSRNNLIGNNFDVHGSTSPVGLGLIVEVSRSYSDTSRSVGLLGERSTRRRDLYLTAHNTQQTDIHAADRIRTHNPSRRAASDLRPLGPAGNRSWSVC
jgi:hypothetical protein